MVSATEQVMHFAAAALRGAAAGGHLLQCRSSTMNDIACVAAPCICPPGARAEVHHLFRHRPLVPYFLNTATYFKDADERWQTRSGLAGFRGPKGCAARCLFLSAPGVKRARTRGTLRFLRGKHAGLRAPKETKRKPASPERVCTPTLSYAVGVHPRSSASWKKHVTIFTESCT